MRKKKRWHWWDWRRGLASSTVNLPIFRLDGSRAFLSTKFRRNQRTDVNGLIVHFTCPDTSFRKCFILDFAGMNFIPEPASQESDVVFCSTCWGFEVISSFFLFGGSKDGDPPKTPRRWLDFIAQFFRWTWRIRLSTQSPSACTMILSTWAFVKKDALRIVAGGQKESIYSTLFRWWFQIFFNFQPYLGKIPILTNIFQLGWNHQLVY